METLRICGAMLLGCAGFTLFTYGSLVLARAGLIRFAARRLGQHQGQLGNHTEGL